MVNHERIRGMSVWELATFIHNVSCNTEKITTCEDECEKCECTDEYCISGIAEWLLEEGETRWEDRD